MKNSMKVFALAAFLFIAAKSSAQTTASKVKPDADKEQHISIEQFPKNMVINHLNGWGGMTIAINELRAGTDFAPLLEGLKNNSCQVPHWGYIVKGSLKLKYDDGKEVVLKAGDVFYMAPGHKASVVEDLKLIDFSPEKQMKELISHVEKKIAASKQQ
ncbi:MAG: cupin domain-containing protein [Chitinophagaceae bacterium]|nr:cupin domain-containing protein [Chitinophagaceae bacterium]